LKLKEGNRFRGRAWAVAGAALLIGFLSILVWLRSPWRGLPYHDSFSSNKTDEWTSYAGNWILAGNTIENNSDERGAKFITGSPHWKSYALETDMQLLGTGDAGVLIRASNLERGVDSYDGYYAGLRTSDQTLILGRARHGWREFPPTAMPGGVVPGQWYRLRVAAHGCIISASVNAIGTTNVASVSINDPDCLPAGRVGLRSVGAGGKWRNIRVVKWSGDGSDDLSTATVPGHIALFPTSQGTTPLVITPAPATYSGHQPLTTKTIQSIRNLRLFSISKPAHAIVRGAVILTNPALYIQDSSGGVRVETADPAPLKVGDEVQVEGDVYPHGLSATIRHATEQPLGGLAPIPPLSITADQAATGAYDSMFVEIEGRVEEKFDSAGRITLQFRDGLQTFRATTDSFSTSSLLNKLSKESTVRLRGVCMVSSEYTNNVVPFVLIVGSPEDIKVLVGPPWWSVQHLVLLAMAMLGVGFLVHLFYSRAEKWRLHAVIDERERLAHEIHDTLAQSFAGIGFQLRAIRNRVARNGPSINLQLLMDELGLASELVRHSHDEARRSIAILRPEALEAMGLVSALEQSARRMVARGSVIIEATYDGEARTLPLRVLDSLFRIGQETFANAIQHGHPKQISIRIDYQPSFVILSIVDDGAGFTVEHGSGGFGIAGMRRRAEAINAKLEIDSTLGKGTHVSVTAPTPPVSWLRTVAYTRRKEQESRIDAQRRKRPDQSSHRR
jgi:signal transduction histidine kinase